MRVALYECYGPKPEIDVRDRKRMAWNAAKSLILNAFFPGVGTLLGGRTITGSLQVLGLVMGIVVILAGHAAQNVLTIVYGVALVVLVWLWAIGTGVRMVTANARASH